MAPGATRPCPDPGALLRQRLEIYRAAMARPMVTGSDLISAGLTPDRDFSQLLAYARKLHLAGLDREAASHPAQPPPNNFQKKKRRRPSPPFFFIVFFEGGVSPPDRRTRWRPCSAA